MNRLFYGDCLTIMRDHMKLGSVDLIYLDPPFNSNREYNAIYKDGTGRPLPDQIHAFCDLWELNEERERALRMMPVLMREAGIDDEAVEFWRLWMNALRKTNPRLLAYLSYMVERLLLMKGILKPTGSIYLHCDPTASHYIKVMMDAIFDHHNFRNEIIWHYRRWTTKAAAFQKMHDVLLWYTRSDSYPFSRPLQPYADDKYVENTVRGIVDGKLVRLKDAQGNYVKRESQNKGVPMHDIWHDINFIAPTSKERMGYATQKPVALLKRIIAASSNPGDVVFDPFCGCATTLEAAHELDRRWVGIDIAIHAIKRVAKARLQERMRLVEGEHFTIEGVPQNIEGAQDLWTRDKYHFQKWAVEQVDGFVTTGQSGDGGVDGRLYFAMPENDAHKRRPLESMVIEVKGGKNVGINVIRELRGVLDNDQALVAGLIIMEPLGERKERNFRKFMADAGDLDVLGMKYARMQMLTVAEILDGKRFHTPGAVGRVDQAALPLS